MATPGLGERRRGPGPPRAGPAAARRPPAAAPGPDRPWRTRPGPSGRRPARDGRGRPARRPPSPRPARRTASSISRASGEPVTVRHRGASSAGAGEPLAEAEDHLVEPIERAVRDRARGQVDRAGGPPLARSPDAPTSPARSRSKARLPAPDRPRPFATIASKSGARDPAGRAEDGRADPGVPASRRAIAASARTAAGSASATSPSVKATWKRTRIAGSSARAMTRLLNAVRPAQPGLGQRHGVLADARGRIGQGDGQVVVIERVQAVERPERVQAAERVPGRRGASPGAAATADRSCRSKISRCAVSRCQALGCSSRATSSAVVARESFGVRPDGGSPAGRGGRSGPGPRRSGGRARP